MAISKTTFLSTLADFKARQDAYNATAYGVTVEKLATATEGYAASYSVKQNGVQVGATINIPKDFLVKSATIETVTTANAPYTGAAEGDKYVDFVVNSVDNDATAQHLYLPVTELVDAYAAGNGLELGANNTFAVKIDSANANGLSVGANGVALAAATTSTAGAMSAADKIKLDGITDETITAADLDEIFGTNNSGE